MPRKWKPKNQQDTPVGERAAGDELEAPHEAAVLHAGFTRLAEIEAEIASETERHLSALRQDRKDAWDALKAESGMQREELAPYYAIFKRAKELDAFEDQAAATVLKDKMRRLYRALPAGETMNFLDAIDGEAAANGNAEAPKSAYREGRRDHGIGMSFDQCPYPEGDAVNREAWQSAWLKSEDEWRKHAPPDTRPSAPVEPVAAQH